MIVIIVVIVILVVICTFIYRFFKKSEGYTNETVVLAEKLGNIRKLDPDFTREELSRRVGEEVDAEMFYHFKKLYKKNMLSKERLLGAMKSM